MGGRAHASDWEYCLRVLHLREGAAGRRIGAMRVLRRLPRLEPALRDGRLCLSTIIALGPHLTDENLDTLVEQVAFKTKEEVEPLVVSIAPRRAPRDGVRKVTSHEEAIVRRTATDGPPPASVEAPTSTPGVPAAGAGATFVEVPAPETSAPPLHVPAAGRSHPFERGGRCGPPEERNPACGADATDTPGDCSAGASRNREPLRPFRLARCAARRSRASPTPA